MLKTEVINPAKFACEHVVTEFEESTRLTGVTFMSCRDCKLIVMTGPDAIMNELGQILRDEDHETCNGK